MTPDGRYILFDQARGSRIGETSDFRAIWRLDTVDGTVTQLSRGALEQTFPSVSPDGRVLLFGDSNPVAVPGAGAFERSFLQALPFTQSLVDTSNDDASVRGADGTPFDIYGRAAVY